MRSVSVADISSVPLLDRYQGCLLGGAVGDALGAPVEFMSLNEIRRTHGPLGVTDFLPAYGRIGAITDDTQMTLFTAEGLLRADNRFNERGICHPPSVVYFAYLRWLETQGEVAKFPSPDMRQSWLTAVPALRARRAPGNTCLEALRQGTMATMEQPVNNSKGCGGVMRVAPVGLLGKDSFQLGCELAALTHGHPSGFLAAGFLAAMIEEIIAGAPLAVAARVTVEKLRCYPSNQECLNAVARALDLAESATVSAETVESLGQGWVAEESLAIALYCSLVARNFEQAVLLAVNHSGDSDSTGSITGNILGVMWGTTAIPSRWLSRLELKHEIAEVARDLFVHFGDPQASAYKGDWDKYPGC